MPLHKAIPAIDQRDRHLRAILGLHREALTAVIATVEATYYLLLFEQTLLTAMQIQLEGGGGGSQRAVAIAQHTALGLRVVTQPGDIGRIGKLHPSHLLARERQLAQQGIARLALLHHQRRVKQLEALQQHLRTKWQQGLPRLAQPRTHIEGKVVTIPVGADIKTLLEMIHLILVPTLSWQKTARRGLRPVQRQHPALAGQGAI